MRRQFQVDVISHLQILVYMEVDNDDINRECACFPFSYNTNALVLYK